MATVHTHTGHAFFRLLLRRRLPLPGRPFQSQARRIELSCLPIHRSRRPVTRYISPPATIRPHRYRVMQRRPRRYLRPRT